MTQRERYLSILVGGMLIAVVIWWGFGKYRSALKSRNNQIASLQAEQQRLTEQKLQGEYANRQMGEYLIRSLSGNKERAQSDYYEWLLNMVRENNLYDARVNTSSRPRPTGGLYQQFDYRVQGNTDLQSFVGLMHAFYAKDFLHRIRELSFRPNKDGGFQVQMSVDAISLLAAPDELPARELASWRVDGDVTAYRDPTMNRNFFEPPNNAPRYTGGAELQAIVGRDSPIPLTFDDAEKHELTFDLGETSPPYVRIDPRTGTLRVNSDEKREIDLLVRVTDNGYPRRTTEQKLRVQVVDPPPPPKQEPPKLAFDDAKQTVLTALTQGREEWTAWMHVRTKDKTLRLRVGDGFEIGSLKGTVVEVTPRFVMLEIDGRRFTLKLDEKLKDAASRSEED